jgi:hypothetical protein
MKKSDGFELKFESFIAKLVASNLTQIFAGKATLRDEYLKGICSGKLQAIPTNI